MVEPLEPGATEAEIFFLNETEEPLPFQPPQTVSTIRRGSDEPLVLHARETPLVTVPARGFVKLVYAQRPSAPPPALAAEAPPPERSGGSASPGLLAHLEPHEPMYFITGAASDRTKVQISFAVPIFEWSGGNHIRFAYTQTMLWAMETPSWPFSATTYSPRLFAMHPLGIAGRPVELAWGIAHDSTGLAGRGSRDVNRLFVRLSTDISLGDSWSLRAAPTAFYYLTTPNSGADDIIDYWGYGALQLAVEQRNGFKLSALLRGSFSTGRGAAEINASYPLRAIHVRAPALNLFAQLFTGYGESLLRYEEERTHLRFGIAFVR